MECRCSPAHGSHGNSEVPTQRQVPALRERLDGPALVQDDHQVWHLRDGNKHLFIIFMVILLKYGHLKWELLWRILLCWYVQGQSDILSLTFILADFIRFTNWSLFILWVLQEFQHIQFFVTFPCTFTIFELLNYLSVLIQSIDVLSEL